MNNDPTTNPSSSAQLQQGGESGSNGIPQTLKPCPFCDSAEVDVSDDLIVGQWQGWCKCGASGPIRKNPEAATEAWNERQETEGGDWLPSPESVCVDVSTAEPPVTSECLTSVRRQEAVKELEEILAKMPPYRPGPMGTEPNGEEVWISEPTVRTALAALKGKVEIPPVSGDSTIYDRSGRKHFEND